MKHLQIGLLIFFLSFFSELQAQQNHFIYIQTENKQPFYVKLDKKLYNSSESGYLVVPKLKEGNYTLVIGFPKSEWAEQNMLCTLDNSDKGYLLKKFDNKGWGLFNLQTMAVVMASDSEKIKIVEVVNKTDAFSNMLSTVVNDSTIRQTEKIKEEVKKEEEKAVSLVSNVPDSVSVNSIDSAKKVPVTVAKETDTITALTKENERPAVVKQVAADVNNLRSSVTRTLLNKNADGMEMIYVDDSKGEKDTIRVFIPGDRKAVSVPEEKPAETEKPRETETPKEVEKKIETPKIVEEQNTGKTEKPNKEQNPAGTEKSAGDQQPLPVKAEEKSTTAKFLDVDVTSQSKSELERKLPAVADTEKVDLKSQADKLVEPVAKKTLMINSDCKSVASEEDFLKLRKKMAAESNDDDMIMIAKKAFKMKCYTVEQVKNLGVLFLKDAGKYAFFDMTYPFVSDSHNFVELQNQLSETYYINRFQSMIRH